MRGEAAGGWVVEALAGMTKSNEGAAQCLLRHGATSCTDVTGNAARSLCSTLTYCLLPTASYLLPPRSLCSTLSYCLLSTASYSPLLFAVGADCSDLLFTPTALTYRSYSLFLLTAIRRR